MTYGYQHYLLLQSTALPTELSKVMNLLTTSNTVFTAKMIKLEHSLTHTPKYKTKTHSTHKLNSLSKLLYLCVFICFLIIFNKAKRMRKYKIYRKANSLFALKIPKYYVIYN